MGLKYVRTDFLIGTTSPSAYNLHGKCVKRGNIDVRFLCVQTVQTLWEIIKLYSLFFTNRMLGTCSNRRNLFIISCQSDWGHLLLYGPPELIVAWGREENSMIVSA